jgi:hypothetical protein
MVNPSNKDAAQLLLLGELDAMRRNAPEIVGPLCGSDRQISQGTITVASLRRQPYKARPRIAAQPACS